MSLETAVYVADLVETNPTSSDPKSQGDDHLRTIKSAIKKSFPGFTGAVVIGGTTIGSANTYILSPNTALSSLTDGSIIVCKIHAANTGASTLNISGLGARAIKRSNGDALTSDDMPAGRYVAMAYNGSDFQLIGVTKQYIDQLLFAPVLPNQGGNSGKYLTTDGTNAKWEFPGVSKVGDAVTSNATLTSASEGYQPVSMSSIGKSITLPDATTMTVGGPKFILNNAGVYPFGVRNSAGVLLVAVSGGGEAYVSCKDNSTAAGGWGISGVGIEPGLMTIDNTFSATYTSTVFPAFVALDSATSIHFLELASGGFAAYIVDNAGKVLTTPVSVTATSGDVPCQAFATSATTAIVFYKNAGTLKARVITVSGTSPSLSLSVGAQTTVATGLASINEDFSGPPKIARLSASLYLFADCSSNGAVTNCVAISVSGTTVTMGAAATITSTGVANSPAVYAVTSTRGLVIYSNYNAGNPQLYAVIVSVSGTTCTVNTATINTGSLIQNAMSSISSCLLSSTKAIIAFGSSTSKTNVQAITISGLSVSFGTNLQVDAAIAHNLGYGDSAANRYAPHLYALTASTALLWYFGSTDGISRAMVLTESAGAVTAGTVMYRSINNTNTANASGAGMLAQPSASDALSIMQQSTSAAGNALVVAPMKISGTTITQGAGEELRQAIQLPVTSIGVSRLPAGDYIITPTAESTGSMGATSMTIIRSNGDAAICRGVVSCPMMAGVQGPGNQAVSANRLVIHGGSVAGSTAGASTLQMRVINLEVAQ